MNKTSVNYPSRREFLRRTGIAAASLHWALRTQAQTESMRRKGKACILLWMQGGPSQLESFDPKPDHANGGPTKVLSTSVTGIQIAEHFPHLAQAMDDIAVIRSATNKEGNHLRATYQLHTGYAPTGAVQYPSLGAVAAKHIDRDDSDLPDSVTIGRSVGTSSLGGGFLGVEYDSFELMHAGERPLNLSLPVGQERFQLRKSLLDDLQLEFANREGNQIVAEQQDIYERASRFALSPNLDAFDVSKESQSVLDHYGAHAFGKGCLLARRLVESGVTFVEVHSEGRWDTHQGNFEKTPKLAAEVDRPFAQLISDLKDRGRLQDTLVIWMGEFGRTPRINNRDGGRDHFPRAFSVALAGGGVLGGQFVGRTSRDGTEIVDRPVSVPDLYTSVYKSLGIDPTFEHVNPLGRPIKIVDGGEIVSELFT